VATFRAECTNVVHNLIEDQRNFKAKYLQTCEETELKKVDLSHFSFLIMSNSFILI